MSEAKQRCVDCHFFVWSTRDPGDGRELVSEVGAERRELARKDDFSWQRPDMALECHFGVWDQGFQLSRDYLHEVLVKTDRTDNCFYWKWRPNMLLPAARILQEREAANREASRDRRNTVIGLWIAAIALVANLVVTLVSKLW
jgi:hypothetical protein